MLANAQRRRRPGAAGQSPIICPDRTRGRLFPGTEGGKGRRAAPSIPTSLSGKPRHAGPVTAMGTGHAGPGT